jgi:predicted rRNA methylase YqxC with S4 and FtsJ domains
LLRKGILQPEAMEAVLRKVEADIKAAGFELAARIPSPIKGAKGNVEFLAMLR